MKIQNNATIKLIKYFPLDISYIVNKLLLIHALFKFGFPSVNFKATNRYSY